MKIEELQAIINEYKGSEDIYYWAACESNKGSLLCQNIRSYDKAFITHLSDVPGCDQNFFTETDEHGEIFEISFF